MDVLRSGIQSSYMELREDAASENLCPESHVKRKVFLDRKVNMLIFLAD